jgi:hypothetical protein
MPEGARGVTRQCGDCQLCCRLLPMQELAKPAGARCEHQRHAKGCAIYARRPACCALWTCRWLVRDDTDALRRPDRSHYVIDLMPDYITLRPDDGGASETMQVVQVWIDPAYPDAHRDPALRAYLERRAAEGIAALVRLDAREGFVLVAPALASDGRWHEVRSAEVEAEHRLFDVARALGAAIKAQMSE